MAWIQMEYYSDVLGMNRRLNVLYPERSKMTEDVTDMKDIPVLYLLHGMSGNEDAWLLRTGIDRLVRHTKLAIVVPSTDLGFYTDTTYGMNYFTSLTEELPQVLQDIFPNLSTKRSKHFVAGLSMGGYGAFKFALGTKYFSHAASLSGALAFDLDKQKDELKDHGKLAYWQGLFGDLEKVHETPNSLQYLAEHFKGPKPKLYAWCGQGDFLVKANDYAVRHLQENGFDITYEKSPGTHEWYYWAKYIENVLEWLPIDYVKEARLS
jgi:putative tributyrin esterase